MQNPAEAKRILEAALLASTEPVSLAGLKRLFDDQLGVDTLQNLLTELRADWEGRAVELEIVGDLGGAVHGEVEGRVIDDHAEDRDGAEEIDLGIAVTNIHAFYCMREWVVISAIEVIKGIEEIEDPLFPVLPLFLLLPKKTPPFGGVS